MDNYDLIWKHFSSLFEALVDVDKNEVEKAIVLLDNVRGKRGTVWLVGNGGSAATASHFANDLVKMCDIKAIALPIQVPLITAYGNDNGWENMFADPLDEFMGMNDVLVAISCSGNSENVVRAVEMIFQRVIVLTGDKMMENKLAQMGASAMIRAMHSDITIQEDVHSAVCHAIAKALKV